jgi:23S rRNA pseudouridine2605 synthase
MSERIQKYLAGFGIASRREVEKMIDEGRITVDGAAVPPGYKITGNEKIFIDGKPFRGRTHQKSSFPKVLIYHKPDGQISTRSDPEDRDTVFDRLPRLKDDRWIQVGRLDYNTSGILLFTNHGELAHRLMHPSYEVEREYAVRVMGEVTRGMLKELRAGIALDDGMAKFDDLKEAGGTGMNRWYNVTLHEGRNREVRRLWESFEGIRVSRLIRTSFANIKLPRETSRGRWEFATRLQIQRLGDLVKLDFNK